MREQTPDFHGKVAFVTGATSGIGQATAVAFAQAGARVVVADIAHDGVDETTKSIEATGGEAIGVQCDVTRGEDVRAALAAAEKSFGGIDMAFNNAGVDQELLPLDEIDEDEYDRLI